MRKKSLYEKKEFKGKKVVVMGLGIHGGGVGTAKFFAKLGAELLVTDLKSKEELIPSIEKLKNFKIEYVLGKHRPEDFQKTDLIVKNPAVPSGSPFLKIARKNKVPIETEATFFFKLCPAKIIGVTGTKGKSTVATLIYSLLKTKFSNVVLAGNIRVSLLDKLKEINKNTIAVLELSSFQLEDLKMSPQVAVITNILEDHLDRYKGMRDYIEAKKTIFKYQSPKDFLVLNYDNDISRSLVKKAQAQVYFYSKQDIKERGSFNKGAFIKNGIIFFDQEAICKLDDIKLKGTHNIENILSATTVAKIKKVSPEKIRKVLREFKGLSSRLELIKEIKGISFFNDTCATNPAATIAALDSFEKPVILIAGGAEKNLCFRDLTKKILEKVKFLILLEGESTERLRKELKRAPQRNRKQFSAKNTKVVKSMKEAVDFSFRLAKKGDIVLLSPACSSFGMFAHEFDRGEQFKKAVNQLDSFLLKKGD